MDDIRKKSFIAAAVQAVKSRFAGEKSCESENVRDGAREAGSFERDAMDALVKLYTAIADVSDPDQAGMLVLQTIMDFYDADWVGTLNVDLGVGIWEPFWWISKMMGPMGETDFNPLEGIEHFSRWTEALARHCAIVVPDREMVRDSYPEEYSYYVHNNARSLIGYPFQQLVTGCLLVRNPEKYPDRWEFLAVLWQVIACSMNEKKIMEQRKCISVSDTSEERVDVRIRFFGSPEVEADNGTVTEAEVSNSLAWKVLAYLLMVSTRPLNAVELVEKLTPDEPDYKKAARNLRDKLYKFRNEFAKVSNSNEPLLENVGDGYQINRKMKLVTDYHQFEEWILKAHRSGSRYSKMQNLEQAIRLYRGDLFQGAVQELWLYEETARYHRIYFDIVDELLELLYQEADYPRMQDYAMKALALEPAHPKIYAWAYISMEQQHLHKIAQETLESAKMNLMEAEYAELMHSIGEISEEKSRIKAE